MKPAIFKHKTHARDESEVTRGITVRRRPNGDVEFRISAEGEYDDEISLAYTLSPELAAELGQKLLCIDENFAGLIERASKFGGK